MGSKSAEQKLSLFSADCLWEVPVNLKDGDSFHLTIEEYLLALVSLIDELVRFVYIQICKDTHSA